MAKTIMISNDIYNELKALKRDKSFSELLKNLLDSRAAKKGASLKDCFGILKKDKEREDIEKSIKKGWGHWSKRYA